MRLVLPRLYVILDAALISIPEKDCARNFVDAGVRLIQYRNKRASAREYFEISRDLAECLKPAGVQFIVNDRADVAALAGAEGVHVGQDDLGVEQARKYLAQGNGSAYPRITLDQFQNAAKTSADYIAVGPIFTTASKENPDPVVGTELVRQARTMSDKPIVAIGGITLEHSRGNAGRRSGFSGRYQRYFARRKPGQARAAIYRSARQTQFR